MVNRIREARRIPRSGIAETNRYIDAFLNDDDTYSSRYSAPQLASPPLFAKEHHPGSDSTRTRAAGLGLKDQSELESLLPPIQLSSDDTCDLYKENMAVINGWSTHPHA